ncbi:MAG TPA: ASPIC/UnbV domain-containing protein [Burkholderiaceae bacterium]
MNIWHIRLLGALLLAALGAGARLPEPTLDAEQVLQRFSFDSAELDERFGLPPQQVRHVHKDLRHIAPWISAVGAAAALGDLTGDMKPDDLCHVDTRLDRVVVRSLTQKYLSFALPVPLGPHTPGTVAPMGCLIADFNEDGLPDLLVYFWGRPPVAYLRLPAARQADKGLLAVRADTFVAVDVGDPRERWFTTALTLADVNGDGHPDLIIGNYFCDEGRILDEQTTEPVCPRPVMQDSMSRAFNGGTNRILLWTAARTGEHPGDHPGVEFHELAGAFPPDIAGGWTLAIGVQDLNKDLLPDIYLANDFGPDRLLINCSRAEDSFGKTREEVGCYPLTGPVSFKLLEGVRGLKKPASKVLGRDSFKGMGVDFADLNDDGIPDIFVSNITERWALQESQFVFVSDGRAIDRRLVTRGVAPYADQSEALGLSRSGWAWDAKLVDFDNDGKPEALQAVGFSRGDRGGQDFGWRKSCWSVLQELAMANDTLLKHAATWFDMGDHGGTSRGCDLSGGTPNPFFVLNREGRYEDMAGELFPSEQDPAAPSRGIAIADIDHDGRLDYVVARQYAPPVFRHNTSTAALSNGFVGITPRFLLAPGAKSELRDERSVQAHGQLSRPAFGVVAQLRLSNGRVLTQQVDGGNGHSGKRSADLLFGLGGLKGAQIDSIDLLWRSGPTAQKQSVTFNDLRSGHYYVAYLQSQPLQ